MTSKQVMLTLMATVVAIGGCIRFTAPPAEVRRSPYVERQLWAVAPLRNESGHLDADGLKMADQLARQFENARRIDVMPVNRVIAAMQTLEMSSVQTAADARKLREMLSADGLILGTLTDYEPYDPPKIGLVIELYLDPLRPVNRGLNARRLSRAAVDGQTRPVQQPRRRADQPTSAISAFYDAANPRIREQLEAYARRRGVEDGHPLNATLYRTSIDLYSEFVAYMAASHLLLAEQHRLWNSDEPYAGDR